MFPRLLIFICVASMASEGEQAALVKLSAGGASVSVEWGPTNYALHGEATDAVVSVDGSGVVLTGHGDGGVSGGGATCERATT